MHIRLNLNVQVVRGERKPRGRKRRAVIAAVAAAAAVAAPFAYAAVRNDVFSDVPSTAADHDAINRVYNAGIMSPCNTSPMQFCPNANVLRRGVAKQYDYAFGLSGAAAGFEPTFNGVHLAVTNRTLPPLTVNTAIKVPLLNVDLLDGKDSSAFQPAGHLLFANVAANGTLIDGDATSVTHTSTGSYNVDFGRAVSSCAADVTKGFTGAYTGGTSYNLNAIPSADAGPSGTPSTVVVHFYIAGGSSPTPVDGGFHLVVVC